MAGPAGPARSPSTVPVDQATRARCARVSAPRFRQPCRSVTSLIPMGSMAEDGVAVFPLQTETIN